MSRAERTSTSRPISLPRAGNDGFAFEEVEHLVGDDDPDTSLCGVDQTDVPWNQGLPACQACLAVADGRMN